MLEVQVEEQSEQVPIVPPSKIHSCGLRRPSTNGFGFHELPAEDPYPGWHRKRSHFVWRTYGPLPAGIGSWREFGVLVLGSQFFQMFMAFTILVNAIVIGLETDWPTIFPWDALEFAFLVIFAVDVFLRVFCRGAEEYFNLASADIFWNVLDLSIVSFGAIDFILSVAGDTNGKSTGLITLLRLARLLRILRFFRLLVRFRSLFMLAHGFLDVVLSIFWVSMVLAVVMYVCSVILVRTCGRPEEEDANAEFLTQHFGDLASSMLTLFQLMAVPELSAFREDGMHSSHPLLMGFLVFFIIFGSFGAMALLTGVVCEGMLEKAQLRLEEDRLIHDEKRRAIREQCEELFAEADLPAGQTASPEELGQLIPYLSEVFEANGVSVGTEDISDVLHTMDRAEFGDISKEDFCQAVISLADKGQVVPSSELHHTLCAMRAKLAKWQPIIQQMSGVCDATAVAGESARRFHEWSAQHEATHSEVLRRSQESTGSMNLILQRLADIADLTKDVAESQQRLDQRLDRCESTLAELRPQKAAPKTQAMSIWDSTTSLTVPEEPKERKPKPATDVPKSMASGVRSGSASRR